MVIRCDNCSVSLQLDESKVPNGNFTIRCPRCQNMVRVQGGKNTSAVHQMQTNAPAPRFDDGNSAKVDEKETESEINSAMRSLLMALQGEKTVSTPTDEKPRQILVCVGNQRRETVARILAEAGYKVYLAETPAQANERLREGKVEIVVFSQDFAAEFGGAAILAQKVNALPSSERRRLFLVSLEDVGQTMNAHEAFLRNLNLIVHFNDIASLPLILARSLRDFNELYHYFNQTVKLEPI